jgi:hypothetical protein
MYLQKRIRPVNLPEIIERIQNHPVDKGGNHSQKSILLPHRMQKTAGRQQPKSDSADDGTIRSFPAETIPHARIRESRYG